MEIPLSLCGRVSTTGPPPSGIRKFYGKIENSGDRNEKYLCGICSTVVSSSVAATSNLIKHMRRHHLKEFEEYQREQGKAECQTNARSGGPLPRPSGASASAERRIRILEESHEANVKRLVCLLAGTFLPPSVVDSSSFIQFVQGLEPRFTIPISHQLNMVVIPQTYDELREKLKETLSRSQGVCIAIDVIKDNCDYHFLIILASYITSEWKKSSSLLTCKIFKTLPSESIIQEIYESTVREMNITYKVQSIVTGKMKPRKKDSGFVGWELTAEMTTDDNYSTPSNNFGNLPDAHRCFHDLLQEVVGRGIAKASAFSEQIQKISSLVYSINVLLNGREAGKSLNSATSWTEQLKYMKMCLRCSLEVFQCAVSSTFAVEDQHNFFTSSDRAMLNELLEVFEAFEDASERIQNTKGIASSQVLPIIRGLRHHLHTVTLSHIGSVAKELSEALEQKLSIFESNEVLQRASMVDPRFKTAWCSSKEQTSLQSKLQMNIVQISLKDPGSTNLWNQGPENSPKRPKLFSFMTSERPSPKLLMSFNVNECAREEVSRFLASPCRELDVNPLDFWRGMETEFPLIAAVARRSFCVEVSSGAVKDVFGGDISLSRGIHLSDTEFEQLSFLKANMDKI